MDARAADTSSGHRQRHATMEDVPPDPRPADLADSYRAQEILVGRLLANQPLRDRRRELGFP